jgi:DVNP family
MHAAPAPARRAAVVTDKKKVAAKKAPVAAAKKVTAAAAKKVTAAAAKKITAAAAKKTAAPAKKTVTRKTAAKVVAAPRKRANAAVTTTPRAARGTKAKAAEAEAEAAPTPRRRKVNRTTDASGKVILRVGSRRQVWNGNAEKTSGGLVKSQLLRKMVGTREGKKVYRLVSKVRSENAHKNTKLVAWKKFVVGIWNEAKENDPKALYKDALIQAKQLKDKGEMPGHVAATAAAAAAAP